MQDDQINIYLNDCFNYYNFLEKKTLKLKSYNIYNKYIKKKINIILL